ncbi:glycosyltransferase [uncultured Selenomonas sp.]|uniref:glycosyltransferase n=1 Tax=uncultured Selenomonas sp. TaxID=159275 RepID=UPI00267638E2|nr:glycosyltransferase [uncultured Selenomonas sp.]
MRIAIVTSIPPDRENRGGPSGLIWEIEQFLTNSTAHDVTTIIVPVSGNKYVRQLHTWGRALRSLDIPLDVYDKILVYPDFLLARLPKRYYKKITVLAPDASSMVGRRKYKQYRGDASVSWIKIWYQYLYAKNFLCFEKEYIPAVEHYLVVGKKDRLWLRRHLRDSDREIVKFLLHPLLSHSLLPLDISSMKRPHGRRFVFSGDMRYSYVGKNIIALAKCLSEESPSLVSKLDIFVVGKNNKWIAELFSKETNAQVSYEAWVECYQDICVMGQDVHCVPLVAGGGTKNRVVTALANGVELISTSVGVENIPTSTGQNIYVCNSMQNFAAQMIMLQQEGAWNAHKMELAVQAAELFRQRVTDGFSVLLGQLWNEGA